VESLNTYFANPEAFLLLVLIPVFILWYFLWFNKKRLVIPLSYDPVKMAKPGLRLSFLRWLPWIGQLAGIVCLIIALARPQTSLEFKIRYSEGIDIMLVLDTSGSMEASDFWPNRLEVAKDKALEFIDGRLDDRIGMVLFAEDAFSYAPLTLDYELLRKLIREIHLNIMPNNGTAMGSAIAVAINRMKDSECPSKVMILLTDGASNRGEMDPVIAAKLAKERKIKIYSVGIGKRDHGGGMSGALDEETLKSVAKSTGGDFFRSSDARGLEKIFDRISEMEKVEITEETKEDITDHYPIWLLYSILLFITSYIAMSFNIANPLES